MVGCALVKVGYSMRERKNSYSCRFNAQKLKKLKLVMKFLEFVPSRHHFVRLINYSSELPKLS